MSQCKPIEERFWPKVQKTEGCWIWEGSTNSKGYGKIGLGRAGAGLIAAHRLSYELARGPIPVGMNVLHKCDNPWCVRPDHLFLGTQTENLADMTAKGHRRYRAHPGEENGRAKLSEVQVVEIRNRAATGELRSALAKEYRVCWTTIDGIVARRLWQSLN